MKNKSTLKKALIVLGVISLICIIGIAISLLFAPTFEEGPAKGTTVAFLQALKDGDYTEAYGHFSDKTKRELGGPDEFEKWVKRNNLQIESWIPHMMSEDLDDGVIGVVFTANLTNGEQEPLIIVLTESGGRWEINYFGREPG